MPKKSGKLAQRKIPSPETTTDDTSSEEELEWTKDDESAFLKTLGALKGNTDDIYKNDVNYWSQQKNNNGISEKKEKKKAHTPMYLKDYERKLIIEKEGKVDESSDDEEETKLADKPGYFEEQEEIRRKLKATISGIEEDDDDEILTKKVKSKQETEAEEGDFYQWLKTRDQDDNSTNELSTLKKAWNNPEIDEDDKFLRDYLLNKDYETDAKIANNSDEIDELDEDELILNKQDEYEVKYNYRFEEPDQDFIKQYPRTVSESLRTGNKKRKEKREEYKTRKQEEKESFKREIAKKKQTTKRHLEAKLLALRKAAGDDIPISLEDLEEDFDPKKFDQRMKELFEQKYYGEKEEYPEDEEMEKPVFSDMDDDLENSEDEYEQEEDKTRLIKTDSEAEDNEIEAPNPKRKKLNNEEDVEEDEDQKFRKKDSRRKRKRAVAAAKEEKPLFDPNEKTFEEYLKEYYSLDYEDLIGDQITKFKYRQVVPNSFGLDTGEILNADDSQLNKWASLRKVTSYRADHEEKSDVKVYQIKSADTMKKNKIFSEITKIDSILSKKRKPQEAKQQLVSIEENGTKTKRKRIKKKGKLFTPPKEEKEEVCGTEKQETEDGLTKTPRRRKKKSAQKQAIMENETASTLNKKLKPKKKSIIIDDTRLMAYGINPKKFKAKLKYGKKKETSN